MKSRRTWWLLFSLGAALAMAAMVWISALVLRMESQAAHEASVRLALYRMDFWLSPRIGRERLRPYFEYLSFYPQQRAYTRILNQIEPGEVITPSPLLTFESDVFRLHFQVGASGDLTSPQVPAGNWRDLAESGEEGAYLPAGTIERRTPLLEQVRSLLRPAQAPPLEIETCVLGAETLLASLVGEADVPPPDSSQPLVALVPAPHMPDAAQQPSPQSVQQWASGVQQRGSVQGAISKSDFGKRAASNYGQRQQQEIDPRAQTAQVLIQPQQGAAIVDVESVEVGELVPVWLTHSEDNATPALLLMRRVRIGFDTVYQGILCDWPALRAALMEQVSDIFPDARLSPEPAPSPALLESGRLLGSVPVTLEAPCPPVSLAGPMLTAARSTLGLAWLAVTGAIVAAGITLRSSIHYGEKRSRFASAVTHELRTPLTTFRMYSEMLAEGMVRDDAQRQTYLRTLQQESGRLSTLVENVLTYARLEEGRAARHVQTMGVADLIARVRGVLQRRAEDAGMTLVMRDNCADDGAPLTRITTDPEVLEQILFNLVDNACKYAGGRDVADKRIEIDVRKGAAGAVTMSVRDHGPGISPEHQRAIFRAFDRGAHGPGDTIPGVGLGLALSRDLARDLGGELTLECTDRASGACFRLTLPRG